MFNKLFYCYLISWLCFYSIWLQMRQSLLKLFMSITLVIMKLNRCFKVKYPHGKCQKHLSWLYNIDLPIHKINTSTWQIKVLQCYSHSLYPVETVNLQGNSFKVRQQRLVYFFLSLKVVSERNVSQIGVHCGTLTGGIITVHVLLKLKYHLEFIYQMSELC